MKDIQKYKTIAAENHTVTAYFLQFRFKLSTDEQLLTSFNSICGRWESEAQMIVPKSLRLSRSINACRVETWSERLKESARKIT